MPLLLFCGLGFSDGEELVKMWLKGWIWERYYYFGVGTFFVVLNVDIKMFYEIINLCMLYYTMKAGNEWYSSRIE